jgi:hypothetical protein
MAVPPEDRTLSGALPTSTLSVRDSFETDLGRGKRLGVPAGLLLITVDHSPATAEDDFLELCDHLKRGLEHRVGRGNHFGV